MDKFQPPTLQELYDRLRREAEARRRALIIELMALEEAWGFQKSIIPRDERRGNGSKPPNE